MYGNVIFNLEERKIGSKKVRFVTFCWHSGKSPQLSFSFLFPTKVSKDLKFFPHVLTQGNGSNWTRDWRCLSFSSQIKWCGYSWISMTTSLHLREWFWPFWISKGLSDLEAIFCGKVTTVVVRRAMKDHTKQGCHWITSPDLSIRLDGVKKRYRIWDKGKWLVFCLSVNKYLNSIERVLKYD